MWAANSCHNSKGKKMNIENKIEQVLNVQLTAHLFSLCWEYFFHSQLVKITKFTPFNHKLSKNWKWSVEMNVACFLASSSIRNCGHWASFDFLWCISRLAGITHYCQSLNTMHITSFMVLEPPTSFAPDIVDIDFFFLFLSDCLSYVPFFCGRAHNLD